MSNQESCNERDAQLEQELSTMDPLERIYRNAARAAKVERLEEVPLTPEQQASWNTVSPGALAIREKIENEQAEAWIQIRFLPFGR